MIIDIVRSRSTNVAEGAFKGPLRTAVPLTKKRKTSFRKGFTAHGVPVFAARTGSVAVEIKICSICLSYWLSPTSGVYFFSHLPQYGADALSRNGQRFRCRIDVHDDLSKKEVYTGLSCTATWELRELRDRKL